MKYFAYGSNMSFLRLRARVPSAERIDVCTLASHQLRFHKAGKDGSSKCDAYLTGNSDDVIVGALFNINADEKKYLDIAEGLGHGYNIKSVTVKDSRGNPIDAFTYYAISTDPSLKPYSWYLHHVVVGAIETKVPSIYLEDIQSVQSIEDPDLERASEQRAIYL
jgi:gamma-glutamylcyclotransferase